MLLLPREAPNYSEERRAKWLADAESEFVQPSPTNKLYYSVLLRALWPPGHGLPGPRLSERDIRDAVDSFRATRGEPPYRDVFRRMRELQGEEGFISIIKEGTRYQLQSLDVRQKREPREKPSNALWKAIKEKYDHRCASCGGSEPEAKLSPDHKIPRSRGGSNDLENWQPLCEQCNNIKSNTCRGCTLNCNVCSWAFPDEYRQIMVGEENKEFIRRAAEKAKLSQSDLANKILQAYFQKNKP